MTDNHNLDILLIYPALSVKKRYGNRPVGATGGHLPPLGILSVAAYLRERNYSVAVIDALANNWGPEEIVEYVRCKKPHVVGFSAITPIFHRAVICAEKIKEAFPELLTIIGGHHATILPKEVLEENTCFDISVFGEGELTAKELMDAYRSSSYDRTRFLANHSSLRMINGIVFRENSSITMTSPRALIEDLDSLPYPARDLVPMDRYSSLPNQYKRLPIAHMVVIRGCPYQCAFCSNNAVFGATIRARSPQKVVDEIKSLMETYGTRDISFWDDMMTTNKSWMIEFCDLMIKNKMDITWTCYSRVDTVTKELLQKMVDAGCWNIFFGFESGDQRLLDILGKGITLQQIRDANQWCKDVGISVRASFMIALPGETPSLAQKTIDFAKELSPDYAQFCITTPYPGTKLFREAKKWGKLNKNFSRYNIWDPVFLPFGYKDRSEILKIERRANFQFYFRFKAIVNLLRKINSWEDVLRYLKGFRFLLGFLK